MACAKVTGRELFGADAVPADALWLRVVRSPHARARFTLGDLAPLRAAAGRRADGRRRAVQRLRHLSRHQGPAGAGRRPGALSRRGGAWRWSASAPTVLAIRDAEVPIAWTPEPPLFGIDAAIAPDAPLVQADKPDNLLLDGGVRRGNAAEAFAGLRRGGRGHLRDRLRRARLYRARGRLGAARRRPHRDPCLDPDALHGPRRGRDRHAARGPRPCASCRPPAAAASAASSISRCSR